MIGFFDSGYGGLSVFQLASKFLPEHDLLYLGDNRRTPYGTRSRETVTQWTKEACDKMFSMGCELIIIACHTASSQALRTLQQTYLPISPYASKRILGVTIPVVEETCNLAKKKVGIIGTKGTCNSDSFPMEIKKRRPDLEVFQSPAPLLVPFIEEGWHKTPELRRILKKYLIPFKAQQVDTLILGCTHFPLILDLFQAKTGKAIHVPDPSIAVVNRLIDYLHRHPEIDSKIKRNGNRCFFTTDCTEAFRRQGALFYGASFEAESLQL
jgi:glutamate racemase